MLPVTVGNTLRGVRVWHAGDDGVLEGAGEGATPATPAADEGADGALPDQQGSCITADVRSEYRHLVAA